VQLLDKAVDECQFGTFWSKSGTHTGY